LQRFNHKSTQISNLGKVRVLPFYPIEARYGGEEGLMHVAHRAAASTGAQWSAGEGWGAEEGEAASSGRDRATTCRVRGQTENGKGLSR